MDTDQQSVAASTPPDQPMTAVERNVAQARAAGYGWDEIGGYLAGKRAEALKAGYTDAEIDKYMGFHDPKDLLDKMRKQANENVAAAQPGETEAKPQQPNVVQNPIDAFWHGLEASSGGLVVRNKFPDKAMPSDAGTAMRIADQVGETVGDIPAMVAGAIGGGVMGAGVTAETGPGAVGGAAIGAGAGAFALPAAIKKSYITSLTEGKVKDAWDFAERQAGIWWATAKGALTGATTASAGVQAGAKLAEAGAGPLTKFLGTKAAELGTMVTVSKGLEGQLPTKQDLLDSAILLAFLHGTTEAAGGVKTVAKNLGDNWAKTNEPPTEAALRAMKDPVFRAQMQVPPHPDADTAPVGSSATQTPDGPFIMTWHGSHAGFEAFQDSKIGTGEGAQVFSVGHYSTDLHGIADSYREQGIRMHGHSLDPLGVAKETLEAYAGDMSAARAHLLNESLDETLEPDLRQKAKDAIGQLETANGFIYRTKINRSPDDFIDWDRPLSGQIKPIQDFAKRLLGDHINLDRITGADLYRTYLSANKLDPRMKDQARKFTDEALQDNIAGMKYLAAGGSGGKSGGAKNWVVYDPKDIEIVDRKSPGSVATPFEGDPWEAVGSRIADLRSGESPWQKIKTTAHRIYLDLFRPDAPIRKAVDAIEKGKSLEDAENPDFLYRLAELSNTRSQYMVEKGMIDTEGNYTGPGLKQIFSRFEGKKGYDVAGEKRFWEYALSRWAVEKAAQQKETGVEVEAAMKVVTEGHGEFENTFRALMDWQNGTLKYARDSGLISAEAFDKMVEENKSRIPGYRTEEEAAPGVKGAGPGKTAYNPVKKFFGSDKKVEPILKSLLQDAFLRVELANRNKANLSLADHLSEIGLAGKQPGGKMVQFTLPDAKDVDDFDTEQTIWRMIGRTANKDEVPIIRDGKTEIWKFADPDLVRVLRGYDQVSLSTWQRMASAMTKVTRNLIVMNPLFPVRLMQYDVPWQFITKPGFRNTLADVYVGMRETLGKTNAYDAWLRSGGAERVFDGLSKNAYIKDMLKGHDDPAYLDGVWNVISSPYHGLRAWAQVLNQAQRVGRFARGQDIGESQIRAGVASSEAAFHRAGFGGPAAKAWNAIQPFTAAYLNSLEQTVRGQFGIGKTITGEHFNGAQFTAKALAVITLPMLANWYFGHDKEWYKAAPDWQKDNGLLIHVGPDDGGHTIFFKYPPVLSFLYGALPRRLMEQFVADNPDAWAGIGESFGATFLPPGGLMTYNVFLPFIEHMANHSFFRDQPLVPDDTKRSMLAPEQYGNYTTETAKNLARFLSDIPLVKDMNLAPPVVENYIRDWGGTLGISAVKFAEMALGSNPKAPETKIEDMPLINSWLSRYPSATAAPIQEFEDRWTRFAQVHGSLVKTMETGDVARFSQILSENGPTVAAMHRFNLHGAGALEFGSQPQSEQFRQMMERAKTGANKSVVQKLIETDKAMTNVRECAKVIADLPAEGPNSVSPRDRRQMLDQTYALMQVIAEDGLKTMNEAGLK